MTTLLVWAFDTEAGASDARDKLGLLEEQQLLKLEDAALVVRGADGSVRVRQAARPASAGTLGGTFWGMLIGSLFLAPWLGAVVGAASSPGAGGMHDFGVDDDFIERVGGRVEPGHSAVFMLVQGTLEDRVIERLRPLGGEIISTSLSSADEAKLRATFSADD